MGDGQISDNSHTDNSTGYTVHCAQFVQHSEHCVQLTLYSLHYVQYSKLCKTLSIVHYPFFTLDFLINTSLCTLCSRHYTKRYTLSEYTHYT